MCVGKLKICCSVAGKTVMGDFQRSRSKVWWSNYVDGGTEEDAAWRGPPRGSSSSPSSSHKSQDSGFSDSEASEHSKRHIDSPVEKCDDELTGDQCCECPHSGAERVATSSLKAELVSQCACFGQETDNVNKSVGNEALPECKVDVSSQLPVKKLREKFLQNCVCVPARRQSSIPEKANANNSLDKQENSQHTNSQDFGNEIRVTSPDEVKARPSPSLNRSVPIPKSRTPPKNQSLNESTTLSSPTPSPRSLKKGVRIHILIPSPRSSKSESKLPKCNNDAANKAVDLRDSPKQRNDTVGEEDAKQNLNQTSVCSRPENQDCASDLPPHIGLPAHTSTPKTTASKAPRVLGKKNCRPFNLLNNFSR